MTSSSLVFHCGSVIVLTLTFVSLHLRHNSLPYLELRVYNGYTSEKLNSRSLHFFAADHTARAYVCFLFRVTLLNFGQAHIVAVVLNLKWCGTRSVKKVNVPVLGVDIAKRLVVRSKP